MVLMVFVVVTVELLTRRDQRANQTAQAQTKHAH
jgi:hypothetical protein